MLMLFDSILLSYYESPLSGMPFFQGRKLDLGRQLLEHRVKLLHNIYNLHIIIIIITKLQGEYPGICYIQMAVIKSTALFRIASTGPIALFLRIRRAILFMRTGQDLLYPDSATLRTLPLNLWLPFVYSGIILCARSCRLLSPST